MATRCCCPPESSPGRCRVWSASPTRPSISATRSSRSRGATPAIRSGTPTFSAADSTGSRPNDWKMYATVSRRSRIRSWEPIAPTSRPATRTDPPSAVSSPPTTLRRVVLPDPERPRSATSCPSPTVKVTPRSAAVAVGPAP